MPKTTAIERAIASLDYQIAVLQTAKQKLVEQVKPKAPKKIRFEEKEMPKPRPVGAQTA